ncbi:MAG: pre-peptidase C-terminal domain-containing protein [Planctomycetes bacterium]|nr:pre-peptidase C-terminal domain-containing protein [Planctomycetota bacterium]
MTAARAVARAALAAVLGALPAHAQRVDLLLPRGGQPGQEVLLTAYGRALNDTVGMLALRDGLELVAVEPVEGRTDRVRLRVRIPPDCPLGPHPLLLCTAAGLSRAHAFHVGPLPVIEEDDGPGGFAEAQLVPLEHTVEGRLLADDIDWYAVDVQAGERVVFEVEAVRLGDTDFDVELELFDGDGRRLARADDAAFGKLDPLLVWTFEATTRARVSLRDVAWRGSSTSWYRLHVGTFPRPVGAVPTAAEPVDGALPVRLIEADGRTYEGALQLAERFGPGLAFPRLAPDGGEPRTPPTGLPWLPLPATLRFEGQTDAAGAALPAPRPPVACFGVLGEPGEEDAFKIALQKDERLEIRSLARYLRSPLDSVVYVRDADGKTLGGNDDSGGPDSLLRFRAPADGDYVVAVRDQLGRGGPTFCYRIDVGQPDAVFTLFEAVPGRRAEDFGVAVPRGGRGATLLAARELERDAGIELGFAGVPSGVAAAAPAFVPGADTVPVVFEAAVDAPLGGALLTPTATAGGDAAREPRDVRFVHELPLLRSDGNTVYVSTLATALPLAVCEPCPFRIELAPLAAPIVRGASMALPFRIERDDGFDGTVTVRMLWTPPGIGAGTASQRRGNDAGALSLSARSDAAVRTWPIVLVASAQVGEVTREVSSAIVPLEVCEPWLRITTAAARGEQGERLPLKLTVARARELPGPYRVQVGRLPRGVTVELPEAIAPDADAIEGVWVVAADAAVGRHQPYLDVRVPVDGGEVRHVFGGVELRIDRPLPPELRARGAGEAAPGGQP